MWRWILLLSITICLVTCPLARGAMFEFTLEGTVTSEASPHVNVGDPFVIRYLADSTDLDPSPLTGRYSAGQAIATLPGTTISSPVSDGLVSIFLNMPAGTDSADYESSSGNVALVAGFDFPSGTLTSDALPLALPLGSATTAQWVWYPFRPGIVGRITSYSSIEVPEPGVGVTLAALMLSLMGGGSMRASIRRNEGHHLSSERPRVES
jgi:hypothetical protein